jgi:catechol 2,3-dioxygenase-like lactoylglutathione lyase family enzyme
MRPDEGRKQGIELVGSNRLVVVGHRHLLFETADSGVHISLGKKMLLWRAGRAQHRTPPRTKLMRLAMRRIILFTKDMPAMIAFYRDVLGLTLVKDEAGWKEFDANGCRIALHNGASRVGTRAPKIGFWCEDVADARAILAARGARLGKVMSAGGLVRCEGKDPDGNPFTISSRP